MLVISARRAAVDQAVPAGAARALRLRARLLRAARQLRVRPERQRSAHRARPRARARSSRSTPTSSCRFPTRACARRSGFAEESGIPLRMGLIRNHYVGRTFIQPQQSIRHFGVQGEAEPGAQHPRGQARRPGRRLDRARHDQPQDRARWCAAAGAQEVHVRISCPPTISPCFYGVDTPRRSELIAATHTLDEIREFLDADSVGYLSLEGLMSAVGNERQLVLHVVLHRASIRWRSRATRRRYLQLALKLDKEPVDELTMSRTARSARARSPCVAARSLRVLCVLCVLLLVQLGARRRSPRRRRPSRAAQLKAAIDKLGDLDYATRTNAVADRPPHAGRAGGAGAAAGGRRARRRLRPLSRARPADRLQRSAHARTRCASRWPARTIGCATVAYSFFEHNPDPRDGAAAARGARQGAGRVRPAGAGPRARGARRRSARARRRCSRDVARGEDFFRSAVIEALGDYKAAVRVRRAHRRSPSSTARCRTMRRWRSGRSATSARSRRWRRCSGPRRAQRSRRSPRRSACSASTARRTRAT